jgi:ketopantoate reductase
MHILIIGTGNLGLLYGWMFSQSGHRVTHLTRNLRPDLQETPVVFQLMDRRKERFKTGITAYMPDMVTSWKDAPAPDWIIAPIRHDHLLKLIPDLEKHFPGAKVALMGNFWMKALSLSPSLRQRTLIGFPHHGGQLAGGKWRGALTRSFSIWDDPVNPKPITREFSDLLAECGLNPHSSPVLDQWMAIHLAYNAGMMAALLSAGNLPELRTRPGLGYMWDVIKEGMQVMEKQGINTLLTSEGRTTRGSKEWFMFKMHILMGLPFVQPAIQYYLERGRQEALAICHTLKCIALEAGFETRLLDQVLPWEEGDEKQGKFSQICAPHKKGADESIDQEPIHAGS